MFEYRCNDCGREWKSSVEEDECPMPYSYCGSKNVSIIAERDEAGEWVILEPYDEALARSIANDPLR